MKKIIFSTLVVVSFSLNVFAEEPNYCQPEVFFSKEVKFTNNIRNARFFKLGDTLIFGAAVGFTKAPEIIKFVSENSTALESDKYCTWYLNEKNQDASKMFTHIYLSHPKYLTTITGPEEYGTKLKDQFAHERISFLNCAINHKFFGMGCNGQMHRGPTAFGMMLAYSGCSPENASTIVNTLWGLNGVPEEVRLAIIAEGKKLGDQDPEARLRLQKAFGN